MEVSSYPPRNADNYTQIHSRTAFYGSSFLPSAIREWNKLPIEHRNAESQDMFKAFITDTKNKVSYYYYCGNRIEQMLLTHLRTECSSLNFYLHRRNLIPSPNCVCGAIENNKHYLLDCHQYVNARDEILNIIIRYSNITADILLFGNKDLSVQINLRNFQSCTCLYSQNQEVHVISPIII